MRACFWALKNKIFGRNSAINWPLENSKISAEEKKEESRGGRVDWSQLGTS